MKTDAVYARQSVEKKDSLSIAGQIDLFRRTAGSGELRVYKDAGYSGKNTERPAFQQLMKDIRADRIGTLYVYRLDRFSRSVADFGQLWEVLQEHHDDVQHGREVQHPTASTMAAHAGGMAGKSRPLSPTTRRR